MAWVIPVAGDREVARYAPKPGVSAGSSGTFPLYAVFSWVIYYVPRGTGTWSFPHAQALRLDVAGCVVGKEDWLSSALPW